VQRVPGRLPRGSWGRERRPDTAGRPRPLPLREPQSLRPLRRAPGRMAALVLLLRGGRPGRPVPCRLRRPRPMVRTVKSRRRTGRIPRTTRLPFRAGRSAPGPRCERAPVGPGHLDDRLPGMVVRHRRAIEENPRILRAPLQGSQGVASVEVDVPAIVSRVLDLLGTQREWVEARLHGQAGDLGTDLLCALATCPNFPAQAKPAIGCGLYGASRNATSSGLRRSARAAAASRR
jgi:hypothetical protein